METFFVCIFGIIYVVSTLVSGLYFLDKRYDCKIIYFIAGFMPLWNTYLAILYFKSDFGSFMEAIKYHFTWEK